MLLSFCLEQKMPQSSVAADPTEFNFTQAPMVNAVAPDKPLKDAISTPLSVLSKDNALPWKPSTQMGVLTNAPPLLLPDESATVVPEPSSNSSQATKFPSLCTASVVNGIHTMATASQTGAWNN